MNLEIAHPKPAIVLVSPKGPDNVGSVARAMKNFGLSDLRIVQPRCNLEQAHMMAVHAVDVIENAGVFESLLDAVAGCDLIAATTARVRRDHSLPITPREAAPRFAHATSSAVVFGREEHGLFNEELDLCHVHIRIPTDADYVSMNLAQAVQVVVYELMLGRTNLEPMPAVLPGHRKGGLSRPHRLTMPPVGDHLSCRGGHGHDDSLPSPARLVVTESRSTCTA